MARIETWLKSDLKTMIHVTDLTGELFDYDSKGNLIGVEVTDDGQPAVLEGTVFGYVIKSDGNTLKIPGGITGGNKAYFVLTQEAYKVGPISIVIKLATGDVLTTLAACTTYVRSSKLGSEVVPSGTPIPSLESLEEAIRNANAAAEKINGMDAEATGLPYTADPTVTITDVNGHKHIALGIPQGAPGDATIDDTAGAGDTTKVWSADKSVTELGKKADKVTNATNGNLAALDANGNLTDSGKKPSSILSLGTSSTTAYRGDRGNTAYTHATDANRLTTAQAEGLYKVSTTAHGHIKSVSAVQKSDITALGIPGESVDISGKADKVSGATNNNFAALDSNGNLKDSGKKAGDFLASSLKGAVSGVAELDSGGKVPSSQLPSYVDDVLEYASLASFPATGESGKIYVAADTNKTYRWSGTAYVVIASDLALGETSSTAYRGDRGKTAYTHATDENRLTTAQTEGLYKIAVTGEGHVQSVTPVEKNDITALGIPGSDTNTIAAAYLASFNRGANQYTASADFTDYKDRTNNVFMLAVKTNYTLTVPSGYSNFTTYMKVNGVMTYPLYINNVYTHTNSLIFSSGVYWVYFNGSAFYLRTDGLSAPKINGYTIGSAIQKSVDTSVSEGSTSTNLPTSQAVATLVSTKASKNTATQSADGLMSAADKTALDNNVITTETVSGTTPTITGVANHRYICGECSTLSITPPSSGVIDVIFESGSTATVLTLPNTVKTPEWFEVEADKTYEINIMDGVYGSVMAWA